MAWLFCRVWAFPQIGPCFITLDCAVQDGGCVALPEGGGWCSEPHHWGWGWVGSSNELGWVLWRDAASTALPFMGAATAAPAQSGAQRRSATFYSKRTAAVQVPSWQSAGYHSAKSPSISFGHFGSVNPAPSLNLLWIQTCTGGLWPSPPVQDSHQIFARTCKLNI